MTTGVKIVKRRKTISSSLIEEPSITNIINIYGEFSQRFYSPESIRSHIDANFPLSLTSRIAPKFNENVIQHNIDGYLHAFKDLFWGEKREVIGTEEVPIRIGELHRPKIKDCSATYSHKSSGQGDFSLAIKIFGIGGGSDFSKQISLGEKIETSESCVALTIPATIEWTKVTTRHGDVYYRSRVTDINIQKLETPELLTPDDDHCLVDLQKVKASKWPIILFDVPKGITRTKTLSIKTSASAEFSLQVSFPNIQIGPKVKVQLVKEIESSYKLVGKHSYSAFIPSNKLGYCWKAQ